MTYKNFLVDIKPYRLRDTGEWTVHVNIDRDTRDAIEHVKKIETGERFQSELEAIRFGEAEGKRFIDGL